MLIRLSFNICSFKFGKRGHRTERGAFVVVVVVVVCRCSFRIVVAIVSKTAYSEKEVIDVAN